MPRRRKSGLLLHPTSLPGRHGIGELGDVAYRFVDFLHQSGQSIWQVLPLGPTGYGDSPYQSFSAFAGNPLLISLELLQIDGLLHADDFNGVPQLPVHTVDYTAVRELHWTLLRRAFERFDPAAAPALKARFEEFRHQHAGWLDDYALYTALKQAHAGAAWFQWEPALLKRQATTLKSWRSKLSSEIELQCFVQFLFFTQWLALKQYANARGVQIMGDIPIFVAHDSVDVWAHADMYHLDEAGLPTVVAGVPPDYFSETGQLWGNPLYRWDVLAKTGYQWWIDRFKLAFALSDIVRLDHFRGFEAFWEIPAEAPSAVTGRWIKGPGEKLFATVRMALGDVPVVAEDLGLITAEVKALRRTLGIPGMAVLQFAFGAGPDNEYLPHNLDRNCVLYTGTHDNDTTCGWFDSIAEDVRHHVRCYLGCGGDDIAWEMISTALRSVADTVIVPVQDLLGLGSSARMNQPARSDAANWSWRFREGALEESVASRLGDLTRLFGRWPSKDAKGA